MAVFTGAFPDGATPSNDLEVANVKRTRTTTLALCLAIAVLAAVLAPAKSHAETRYVADVLVITVRTGPGDEYKIIKTLKTGAAFEVLEETGSHLKVKTSDGTEGWVLKQYVTTDTPKAIVIAGLKREVERLKAAVDKLEGERADLSSSLKTEKGMRSRDVTDLEKGVRERNDRIADLTKQLKELTAKYDKLSKDSGDVVELVAERDRLAEDNTRLSAENTALTKRVERLNRRSAVYWFLAGGFVLLIGWAIGQISKKRRSSFYSI